MRIAIAALVISAVGCASKAPTPDAKQPARGTAAASSMHLTLDYKQITSLAIRSDVSETKCVPTSTTADEGKKLYECTLYAPIAISVNTRETKQEYQGMDTFVVTGFKTGNNIAVPDTDAARAELASIHAQALKGIERRYRLLTNGCNGEEVEMTLENSELSLRAGEYLSDLRCNFRKRNKKNMDSIVFFYDSMTKGAEYAKAQADSAQKAVVAFMETSAENASYWKGRIKIQAADKADKLAKKISQTAEAIRN